VSSSIYSFEFSPETMNSLRYLENYILTMPNRIENIKVRAVNTTVKKMKTYLHNNYRSAGRGMIVSAVRKSGSLRIKISAQDPGAAGGGNTGGRVSRAYAANILLRGRKSYTGTGSGATSRRYKLRKGSSPPYPTHISSFKVKKIPANHAARTDIRMKASALLQQSIYDQARREGFGPRGGNPGGMSDTPHTTKSVTPDAYMR
jgi:hypothetical protein